VQQQFRVSRPVLGAERAGAQVNAQGSLRSFLISTLCGSPLCRGQQGRTERTTWRGALVGVSRTHPPSLRTDGGFMTNKEKQQVRKLLKIVRQAQRTADVAIEQAQQFKVMAEHALENFFLWNQQFLKMYYFMGSISMTPN
jgi:hypothetical protein